MLHNLLCCILLHLIVEANLLQQSRLAKDNATQWHAKIEFFGGLGSTNVAQLERRSVARLY